MEFQYHARRFARSGTICTILRTWKVENTDEGVLFLVKLLTEACKFSKLNTTPCVFFKFLKLHKWY